MSSWARPRAGDEIVEHYAAAIDGHGRLLGHREFRASERGYAALLAWMRSHAQVQVIGVESTGNFGAALTRFLTAAGEQVVEVNTPNRAARHRDGKSDRLDAEQITATGCTSLARPCTGGCPSCWAGSGSWLRSPPSLPARTATGG